MNQIWRYSLVSAFLIISDQLIKGTVQTLFLEGQSEPFFFLSLMRSTKSAFFWGAFEISPWWLSRIVGVWLPLLFLLYLIKRMWHYRHTSPIRGWGLALIFTGVLSNWLDRLTLEKVVYFLSLENIFEFNLADGCLFFGAALFILVSPKEKQKA